MRGSAFAFTLVAAVVTLGGAAVAQPAGPADDDRAPGRKPGAVAVYFAELEKLRLVDTASGSKDTLIRELAVAEQLLRGGAAPEAAVALYTIVESPRYADFADFVEYQNAEYYLGVALHQSGAPGAALEAFERVLRRGPEAPYWGPAHRRAVDIAIETRDFAGVLARIESTDRGNAGAVPPSASGERAYLRGRAAYTTGDFTAAEGQFAQISKKSRLYSSALYLRGVIRARKGQWRDAAAAMCEVADTPDDDRFTFVVDERYFTIKDLARLGLGRLAHEQAEYDDAYYHYFQIPDDSVHLPDALFEAAWSMYQKRELATARDLTAELDRTFPNSPVWPEAGLLAGFVELADCKFDASRAHYDKLVAELTPVVAELDRIRKDPDARGELFRRAVERRRNEAAGERTEATTGAGKKDVTARVLGLLRLDPGFLRLHEAVTGLRRAAGEAPGITRAWSGLARQAKSQQVGAVTGETTLAEDEAADAAALEQDLARLAADVARAQDEVERGRRARTLPADVADDETERLAELAKRLAGARTRARALSDQADAELTAAAPAGLRQLLDDDVVAARRLDRSAAELLARLEGEAARLSQRMVDNVHRDAKRVLDKARLGKVDAVIGQKRALDIKVQDLAAGRFPAELHGKLWEQGLIGDDEEFWPFEGEFWADEYEGWR